MQTRTYDTSNTKSVLKAVLNVLQDDNFMVTQANSELGFLHASKQIDLGNRSPEFSLFFSGIGYAPSVERNAVVECTANVSDFGKQTRVRVNFQTTVMDSRGAVAEAHTIDDPKYYQEFFAKVDKGIFIQEQKL